MERKYPMRITGRKKLDEFAKKHPNDKSSLNRWHELMKKGTFRSLVDLRKMFPRTSLKKVPADGQFGLPGKSLTLTIFRISGNNVRLIAFIQYEEQRVFIRDVLTHAEYDKGKWRR